MGLAASQARLLSITSRISDNELRAQLINNQKMRLSSESSQVSENYINALNKTKLVFANYDKDDNAQNVPLTFNNLTAFNQYNNQYGLTNTAGNILISEKEAKLYQQAINSGAEDKEAEFLRLHGIEYTTSYWDTLTDQLKNAEEYYSTCNNDGKVTSDDGTYSFYTADQLKDMYEGNGFNSNYNDTVKTDTYVNFAAYADAFELKMAELAKDQTNAAAAAAKFYDNIIDSAIGSSGSITISASNNITSYIGDASSGLVKAITDNFTPAVGMSSPELANNVQALLTNEMSESNWTNFLAGDHISLVTLKDGTKKYLRAERDENGNDAKVTQHTYISGSGTFYINNSDYLSCMSVAGSTIWQIHQNGGSGQAFPSGNSANFDPTTDCLTLTTTNDDGTSQTETLYYVADNSSTPPKDSLYSAVDIELYIKGFIQQAISKVCSELVETSIAKINTGASAASGLTEDEKNLINSGASSTILTDTINNIKNILFGTNNSCGGTQYADSYNLITILNYLTSGNHKRQESGVVNAGKNYSGQDVYFDWNHLALPQEVFNAYVIDTMMNLFGEPVYGYLYTDGHDNVKAKNGTTDASAEAKWLENLFAKIQSSGYQILANGLASSSDWLQFALENGIVVMEQVNSDDSWQGITYTSCSDISEQTDSTAVTLAEAEYNKAMRQIEAKDEMFDLELKNIDTEHSSLEAEYESVKKAMSGNIERNFQMYG